MQVMFDFSEVRALGAEIGAASAAAVKRAQAAIAAQAHVCEASMKSHAPVDTGALRASISSNVGAMQAEIGTDIHYAIYQEYGTYKMAAHPFAEPAANAVEGTLETALDNAIGDIL